MHEWRHGLRILMNESFLIDKKRDVVNRRFLSHLWTTSKAWLMNLKIKETFKLFDSTFIFVLSLIFTVTVDLCKILEACKTFYWFWKQMVTLLKSKPSANGEKALCSFFATFVCGFFVFISSKQYNRSTTEIYNRDSEHIYSDQGWCPRAILIYKFIFDFFGAIQAVYRNLW